jgi:hypothetical protein
MLLRDRVVVGGSVATTSAAVGGSGGCAAGGVSRCVKECRVCSRSSWNACLAYLAYLMPQALHNLHMRTEGGVRRSHLHHE